MVTKDRILITTPISSIAFYYSVAIPIAKVLKTYGFNVDIRSCDIPIVFTHYYTVIHICLCHNISYARLKIWKLFDVAKKTIAYFAVEGDVFPFNIEYEKTVRPYLDYVATVSKFSYDCMKRVGLKVDDVIYHGIDINEWVDKISKLSIEKPKDKIVFFANVTNDIRKGLEYLIPAFAQVLKERKDVILYLNAQRYGYIRDLKKYIHEIGKKYKVPLEKHIVLTREIKPLEFTDVLKYYKMCDWYLLSSVCEGFGLTLIEAMASKKPIIHIDAPPMNEITTPYFSIRIKYDTIKRCKTWERGMILHIPNMDDYVEKLLKACDISEDKRIKMGEEAFLQTL